MTKLYLEPTNVTPLVEVDLERGLFSLSGRSSPKSSIQFFHPIIESLRKNFLSQGNITANFAFEYFNTSTSKCLYNILREFYKISTNGTVVKVNWYYEEWDDDMKETGQDYEELTGLHFNYIQIE